MLWSWPAPDFELLPPFSPISISISHFQQYNNSVSFFLEPRAVVLSFPGYLELSFPHFLLFCFSFLLYSCFHFSLRWVGYFSPWALGEGFLFSGTALNLPPAECRLHPQVGGFGFTGLSDSLSSFPSTREKNSDLPVWLLVVVVVMRHSQCGRKCTERKRRAKWVVLFAFFSPDRK